MLPKLITLLTFVLICPFALSLEFYTNSPHILELTDETFNATVANAGTAFLVEFYMDTCGHCRAFKPYYEKFAASVSGWNRFVMIGAVNCPNSEVTCRQMNIESVPTMIYFSRRSRTSDGVVVEARKSVNDLRDVLVEQIANDEGLRSVVDFSRAKVDDPRLFTPLSAIIVDAKENDTLGAQLLLDFLSYPQITAVRALPDSANVAGSVRETPSILLARDGDIIYRTSLRELLREGILQHAGLHAVSATAAPAIATTTPTPSFNTDDPSKFFVSEADLLLTIKYTLEDEIPLEGGVFGSDSLQALELYLEALYEYMPTRAITTRNGNVTIEKLRSSEKVHRAIGHLLRWLRMERSLGRTISVRAWKAKINQYLLSTDLAALERSGWHHCKGSRSNFRGYPCGLWTLFHTLTVNAFIEHNNDSNWNPQNVLKAVVAYVNHYFRCRPCKRHFMAMATNMSTEVTSASDSFLWLWRAHNRANARLAGDPTEDPAFPKRQFPPSFLCASCKTSQGLWNVTEVSKFLLRYYMDVKPAISRRS